MKNENCTTALIDDAYKNVRMASYAIDCIIDKIENFKLEELLRKQNDFYLDTTEILEKMATRMGYEPKDINVFLKGSSFASINMQTMFNKETPHIAEMLIQGTTMGITNTINALSENPCDNEELVSICRSIVASEEKFVESLKEFL
ncbi:MAG: hypothetical protein E7356_03550 [Clostridiales bacterium]|nr:hypothetical protein [Clostridiales bacterium]